MCEHGQPPDGGQASAPPGMLRREPAQCLTLENLVSEEQFQQQGLVMQLLFWIELI